MGEGRREKGEGRKVLVCYACVMENSCYMAYKKRINLTFQMK